MSSGVSTAGTRTPPNWRMGRPRRARSGSAALRDWAIRIATFIVLVGAWELYASQQNRALIAPPSEIFAASLVMIGQGSLIVPILTSLGGLFLGIIITFPVGFLLGLLLGRSRLATYVIDPYVSFLYVLPGVALIPLLVLWFGFGLELRLALVFLAAVFPLIVVIADGVRHVDAELEDGARSYNATEWQVLWTVVIPGSFPFTLAGLRIAFASAWVAIIVAEMTALITGMGGLIVTFANEFKTAALFVPIIVIMIVGILVNFGMDRLYRRYGDWGNRGLET